MLSFCSRSFPFPSSGEHLFRAGTKLSCPIFSKDVSCQLSTRVVRTETCLMKQDSAVWIDCINSKHVLPAKFLRWHTHTKSIFPLNIFTLHSDWFLIWFFFSFLFNILQFPYYRRPETAASIWDCVCPFSCFWLSVWIAAQLLVCSASSSSTDSETTQFATGTDRRNAGSIFHFFHNLPLFLENF